MQVMPLDLGYGNTNNTTTCLHGMMAEWWRLWRGIPDWRQKATVTYGLKMRQSLRSIWKFNFKVTGIQPIKCVSTYTARRTSKSRTKEPKPPIWISGGSPTQQKTAEMCLTMITQHYLTTQWESTEAMSSTMTIPEIIISNLSYSEDPNTKMLCNMLRNRTGKSHRSGFKGISVTSRRDP